VGVWQGTRWCGSGATPGWASKFIWATTQEAHCHTPAGSARNHHRDLVVPGPQGIAGNEKADEWAKIAAEEPDTRGGMAELLGPGRGTCDAPPKVSCKPQAGGLREEVHPLAYGIGRGGVRAESAFSFVISLVRIISSWDRPGRRAKGACNVPPPCGQRTGKLGKMHTATV